MSNLIYQIDEQGEGLKIVDYMTRVLQLSGRFTKSASKEKRIMVNGKPIYMGEKLKTGDVLEVSVTKEEHQEITPQDLKLDIIYEDEDLIVVNKPPFMLVHPTPNHPSETLSNGLLHHFQEHGEKCIVRLVSRLDRDTSGLVLIAKNTFAHMNLAKAAEEKKLIKAYRAIIHGQLEPRQGTIDLPIGKSIEDPIKRCVSEEGQRSITHYQTIINGESASLVQLILETGRTHQIRVHLSHRGCPLFGDILYGNDDQVEINRQALHAHQLIFPHPRTGELLTLTSELPADMKDLLEKLNIKED